MALGKSSKSKSKPKMSYQTKASVAQDRARGYKGGETDVGVPTGRNAQGDEFVKGTMGVSPNAQTTQRLPEKKIILNPSGSITYNGLDISQKEFELMNRAKQAGTSLTDPRVNPKLADQYNREVADKADLKLREQVTAKAMQDKRVSEIQGQQNPQLKPTGLQTTIPQNVESNIGINPETGNSIGTIAKEFYGSIVSRAISQLASGRVSSALGTVAGGVLNAEKVYVSGKTEDTATDFKKANEQIDNVIVMAKEGMDELIVRKQWNEALTSLGQVDSNLQRLSKIDESYYQTTGRELKAQLEETRVNLPQYELMLNEAIQMGKLKQPYIQSLPQ